MLRPLVALALVATAGLTLAACDTGSSASTQAHLTLRLTDAPFPFDLADSANVTIARVEMTGTDSTDGDTRTVLYDGAPFSVNLLDLRNGVDTTLAGLMIPTSGEASQLRFILADDARVVFADGRVFDLRVPSGQQSGIKVNLPAYELDGSSDSLDVLIDFDVERSFVVRGNPAASNFQGFTFKPHLKVQSFTVNRTPVPTDTTGNG